MVLDPIPQSLPVHFFGSRPQPPTSRPNRFQKKPMRVKSDAKFTFATCQKRPNKFQEKPTRVRTDPCIRNTSICNTLKETHECQKRPTYPTPLFLQHVKRDPCKIRPKCVCETSKETTNIKRDQYTRKKYVCNTSKKTHECQKRPTNVKRDPQMSKETHECQKRPTNVKRHPPMSKEIHECQKRPTNVKTDP